MRGSKHQAPGSLQAQNSVSSSVLSATVLVLLDFLPQSRCAKTFSLPEKSALFYFSFRKVAMGELSTHFLSEVFPQTLGVLMTHVRKSLGKPSLFNTAGHRGRCCGSVGLAPAWATCIPHFPQMHHGRQQIMACAPGALHPRHRPEWSSWLLALSWLSPGGCSHLVSKLAYGRSLSVWL